MSNLNLSPELFELEQEHPSSPRRCQHGAVQEAALPTELEDEDLFESLSHEWEQDELSEALEAEFAGETWQSEVPRNTQAFTRWIQQSLNTILSLNLMVDGIMGPATRSAIRSFQQKRGLVVDGVVGPKTQAALVKASGGMPPEQVVIPPTDTIKTADARLTRFDKGSAKLKDFHAPDIDRVADKIAASWSGGQPIFTVYVKGHASSEGPDQYNVSLGLRRALAVRSSLQKALEHKQKNLSYKVLVLAQSKGVNEPIATNITEEGKSQNRRVEIFLSTKALAPLRKKNTKKPLLPKDSIRPENIPWVYPELPRPTLPTDDEECRRELERRLRECNKNYARCVGEKGFNVIVERLKNLTSTVPGCLAAIASGNVWKILHCAYKVGVIDIDTFIDTKKAIDDCIRTRDRCRHLVKVNVRCP